MGLTQLRGGAADASMTTLCLGGTELTYLPDGVHHVRADQQFPTTASSLWERHSEVFDDDGMLVMSVGSILIRTPEHRVLVDIGFGPRSIDLEQLTGGAFSGDLVGGRLMESLAAAGVQPEEIDAIVFSHLHLDHIGWLEDPARPGRFTFPRARLVAHRDEWEHWRKPENIALGAAATSRQIDMLERRIETPTLNIDVVPGVSLVHTPGHTPGHLCVLVTGSHSRALVLGDALHCPVELQHPGQSFVFDIDPAAAGASRRRIHEILHAPDTWFAGGHFPNTVFGHTQLTSDGEHDLDWLTASARSQADAHPIVERA